jgi:hypothetical protein
MVALINVAKTIAAVAMNAASAAELSAGYSPSALESAEDSLRTLRIFLVAFTWMVGVGLVLEYKTQLLFICRNLLKFVSLKSNSFDRCQLRKLVWHSLGALLVTVGVLGEFWVEFKQYGAESNFSRASAASRDELNAKASRNEIEAAQLRLKAEELEEQILEQGPRDLLLYGKREESFTNSIRQFKGQKVQVRRCVFGNNEVRDTAERLTALFKNTEWIVSPDSPDWGESNCLLVGPNEPTPSGIWVGTPNPRPTPRTRERAKELVRFLSEVPLAATLHFVGMETARASESRESIQKLYGDPDSIVVTVLGHPSEATAPNSAAVSPFAIGP